MLAEYLADRELVSLFLETAPTEEVDLEIAAEAAIEWARALKSAARAVDDSKVYRVNLIAAEPGSKRWLAKIEESSANQAVVNFYRKWQNVPLIIRLGLMAAIVLPTTAKDTWDVYFGDGGFTDKQLEQLRDIGEKVSDDHDTIKHKREMYRKCQQDRSITGLGCGVPDRPNWRPDAIVPANRFAEGDGLFSLEEEPPEERPIFQTLDVILVSPNLDNPKLTWAFRQEGIPGTIKASISDERFLKALENGRVREKFHSPIRMKIKLKITEALKDGEWTVKHGGRTVIEVISPEID